jgi:hypothetical protein
MSETSSPNFIKYLKPLSEQWMPLAGILEGDDNEQKEEIPRNLEEFKATVLSSLQMQNLSVLAGSGCSLGSVGGPSMDALWKKAAFDEKQAIKSSVQTVAAKINFNLSVERPNIEEFLSLCDAYLQFTDDEDVKLLVKDFKAVILAECSFVNDGTDLDGHEIFLHRLSRRRVRDSRLKVFTTNYDSCFEHAAGKLGLVAIDGFSFTQPRLYDPRFFGYDIVRRPKTGEDLGNYLEGVIQLYKLHGSVTWARNDAQIFEKTSPTPDETCLIYPAKGKYQQSYIQPHLELISQYLSTLREPNTCLIVAGFGFNDDHLSEPILSAVKSNPHLRLIIVDFYAENNWNGNGNSSQYWKKLKELALQGEDIWFVNASFQDFSKLIPDLRSLSKAERLAKEIKSVTGGH